MRKLLYIYLFIAAAFLSSCSNDFLDVEPSDAVSEDIIFANTQTADANMVGIYDAIVYYYGLEGYRWVFGPDVMGEDIFVRSTNNYGRFSTQVYPLNYTPESSRVTELWTRGYRVVKSCNDIINKIDGVEGTDNDKNKIKAEALTARAFAFLKLIRMYGEYPYSHTNGPSSKGIIIDLISDPSETIGRSTVEDAYKQIASDLNAAIGLFPTDVNGATAKWRFDKRAAHALLANAYLDMENWSGAATQANAARGGINDGSDLMNQEQYLSGFNSYTSETIWERTFIVGQTHSFLTLASFAYTNDDGDQGFVFGYNSLRAAHSFVNIFADTDYRKKLFATTPADEGVYFTKHRHPNGDMGAGRNIPRIRTSEMYLIEAEAEAAQGNNTKAQDILYSLQQKRDETATESTATGNNLIDEIMLERRKELFAEGHRLFDIKRRNLSYTRTGEEHWQHNGETIQGDDYRLNLPIPLSEINANQEIDKSDQNRGY